jgi:hypothetical protein
MARPRVARLAVASKYHSRGNAEGFRRDSAGDPFEAEIGQHRPSREIHVSAGQTVFSRVDQDLPTPLGVFELYYDI